MALEALGIAANVAGLIELGLTVCHGIYEYYGAWKNAENDVKRMHAEIESLTKTFAVLKATLCRSCLNMDIINRIEELVGMCEDGITCLHRKLQKLRATSPTASTLGTKVKAHIQRALYPFRESTLVKLREISRELQEHLLLALNVLQVDSISTSTQHINTIANEVGQVSIRTDKINDNLHLVSNDIHRLIDANEDQRLSAVRDWLSPLSRIFSSIQFETFNTIARQDGLGVWLLDSREYRDWLSTSGKTLWCLGSRGIGKTVLAYKDPQKHSPLNLLGCLLQQLLLQSSHVFDEVAQVYEGHRKAKTDPSVSEYSTLLQSAVGYFTKTTIVVDALDECPDDTQESVMEEINRIQHGVSVLVTSRHALNIPPGCQTAITVKLRANDMDIEKYLEVRLDKSKLLRSQTLKDKSLHDYVISSIVGKAKGMFLLARLQFESIMAKPTLRKIKSALKELPEELDSMYDQAIERIQNQDPELAALAIKLLCWTHYAARPLRTDELRHAVAIEPHDTSFDEEGLLDQNLVESICAGLLTIQVNDTVGLVHYTAQEYLERHSSSLFPGAHGTILNTCLSYLSFEDFQHGPCPDDESFVIRCTSHPFILYASQHWADHSKHVGEEESKSVILGFLSHKEQLRASIQAAQVIPSRYPHWSQDFAKNATALWLASSYGLSSICTTLLEGGDDPNECDSYGQAPVHRAAICGSVSTVQMLLHHNVDTESQSLDFSRTPLHWAAWQGHQGVVVLLLANGASVKARDTQKWTALHLAASQGYVEILDLLLPNLEIDAKDGYGATALYRAAEGGHEAAVRLLLDKGANTDVPNDYDQTPLHRAADLGRLTTARLLLESGAAYDLKDFYGWTPVYRAADHGHNGVADLLADFAEAKRKTSCRDTMGLQSVSQELDNPKCSPIENIEI
ncbi:MAG: hypothetical protein Q9169_006358 [Polycauliona sp. 2 TL-2023]